MILVGLDLNLIYLNSHSLSFTDYFIINIQLSSFANQYYYVKYDILKIDNLNLFLNLINYYAFFYRDSLNFIIFFIFFILFFYNS